jgi:hypothetical protein
LGWPGGIGLGLGSALLRKVSGSILSGANLGGLFSFFKKKKKLILNHLVAFLQKIKIKTIWLPHYFVLTLQFSQKNDHNY